MSNIEVKTELEERKFSELTKFLANFAIISTFIAFALGFAFDKIMSSLSEGVITPFLQILLQLFGIKKLFLSYKGIEFKIYPLISAIIIFALIFGILYAIFAKALKPQIDRIIEYRAKHDLNQIELHKQSTKELKKVNVNLEEQHIDPYSFEVIPKKYNQPF
jgi:large-conductance mechanosensitive channel